MKVNKFILHQVSNNGNDWSTRFNLGIFVIGQLQ